MVRLFPLAAIGAALICVSAAAHEGASAAGDPGDPSRPARTVEIVMNDLDGAMRFSPSSVTVVRGEQVRFVVRNAGALDHGFFIGDAGERRSHAEMMAAMPDMKHDDPNVKSVAPGATVALVWKFSHAGAFISKPVHLAGQKVLT